jgi:Holliday junction resolvase RusA-like endonuclease
MRIYLDGQPRPQPRPRLSKGRVVSIARKATKTWKDRLVAEIAAARKETPPVTTPCGLRLTFFMQTKVRARWGKPHTARPDADNLAKLTMDALVKAGALKDDSFVAEGVTRKLWAERGGVEIIVQPYGLSLEDDESDAIPYTAPP